MNESLVGPDQAKLVWSAGTNAVLYNIAYRESGSSNDWNIISVSRTFKWITGLSPNTTYEWKIKSKCVYNSGQSGTRWTAARTFTTGLGSSPSARLKSSDQLDNATQSLLIYPNPNQGEFNLSMTLDKDVQYTLEIRDITGRIVQNEMITGTGQQVIKPVEINEAQGIYLLRLASDNDISVKRIIIE
jgi:hypothetical protein